MIQNFANVETPTTGKKWQELSDAERLTLVNSSIKQIDRFQEINATRAYATGQVFLEIGIALDVTIRGTTLLDLEDHLKSNVDLGINVWVEPLGDKNSLRNLRGIEMKSIQTIEIN
jgi:hypothetical protein